MAHGDQRGLVLPPKVAPVQAVVIPVAAHKAGVLEKATEIANSLKAQGIRTELDVRDQSPGWKFNEWEMKGVPVRIEVGPRDIEQGVVTYARRDTCQKATLNIDGLANSVTALLDQIQIDMYNKSLAFRDSHVKLAHNMHELGQVLDSKCFAKVVWDKDPACEALFKEKFQATVRVMLDEKPFQNVCTCCGHKGKDLVVALVARAY